MREVRSDVKRQRTAKAREARQRIPIKSHTPKIPCFLQGIFGLVYAIIAASTDSCFTALFFSFTTASIKPANKGCGASGRDWNSGWN